MALELPTSTKSYWLDSAPVSSYPALQDDITCDAVIVGGGIAGLTCAYELQRVGKKVVVLEKNSIASGTTGGTTGKVTTQHGLIYSHLQKRFGDILAQDYASRSQKAFKNMEQLIEREKIDCNWTIADNYIYTAQKSNIAKFKQETAVASKYRLPVSFETKTELPFEVAGAVKFSDQAYMNASAFTRNVASKINQKGSYVFEHSEARHFHEGKRCVVKTKHGSVSADYIIIATKIPPGPLLARGTYAGIEYPETSYLLSGTYKHHIKGMYISPDNGYYSLLPVSKGRRARLLIGGEKHIPGLGRETRRHKKLAAFGEQHFGLKEVTHRWKAMDYIAYDYLPVVGPLYPASKKTLVVSGFKKWGLNLSMVCANLVVDMVLNGHTKANSVFNPYRKSAPTSIPKAVVNYIK